MQAVANRGAQSEAHSAQPSHPAVARAYNCHMGACQFRNRNACDFRNHLVEDHKISVYTVAVMDL